MWNGTGVWKHDCGCSPGHRQGHSQSAALTRERRIVGSRFDSSHSLKFVRCHGDDIVGLGCRKLKIHPCLLRLAKKTAKIDDARPPGCHNPRGKSSLHTSNRKQKKIGRETTNVKTEKFTAIGIMYILFSFLFAVFRLFWIYVGTKFVIFFVVVVDLAWHAFALELASHLHWLCLGIGFCNCHNCHLLAC